MHLNVHQCFQFPIQEQSVILLEYPKNKNVKITDYSSIKTENSQRFTLNSMCSTK